MNSDSMTVFEKAPIPKAVLKNAIPAMAAMLMALIYNLADTFFISQTHSDILVVAVSLATPVFLIFMAVGTVFGIGGTSVLSIGIPASLGSLLMSVSQIVVNARMAGGGDMAVAGMGVVMKVTMITGMVCIGFGQGGRLLRRSKAVGAF